MHQKPYNSIKLCNFPYIQNLDLNPSFSIVGKKIKKQKEKEAYVSLSHHKELHFWTKKENTCTKKKAAYESLNPIGPIELAH